MTNKTENTYCPEIKETLKDLKERFDNRLNDYSEYAKEEEWLNNLNQEEIIKIITEEFNNTVWYPVLIKELQTHLIHAEKDLIDVEKDIKFFKDFPDVKIARTIGKHICFYGCSCSDCEELRELLDSLVGIVNKSEELQLRKTEIEEAIKLIKEGLK